MICTLHIVAAEQIEMRWCTMDGGTRYPKRTIDVLDSRMAYVEVGEGSPVVFLHGNPSSSYLWRNVLPHLSGVGRLIAPDLIGMGDSAKLPPGDPDRYRFVHHARYLDAFLRAVGADRDVVLVLHDWGGALGFDWANRHRGAVRGLAYMETFVRPLTLRDLPDGFHAPLQALRSPDGERLVLDENFFIEQALPGFTLRPMPAATLAEYQRPFAAPGEDRRPTLAWPREVPLDGAPGDVAALIGFYASWLAQSDVPKLFVDAEPGVFITGAVRDFCAAWPNQTRVTVEGGHFVQEDAPDEVGRVLAAWRRELPER
jgi:haloalkane dehalogenase